MSFFEDLPDDEPLAGDKNATRSNTWTVSALANAVKRTLEGTFGDVVVQGELGRVTKHSSGHIYLDLKDNDAVIHAAWFKGAQRGAKIALEQGLEVVVRGRLSAYPARSEYQLIITSVELAGVGALLKLIEDRKKKLAAEGLFDADRKQPLPFLPRVIGIISSPTGAVIHDILHRLQDRFLPHVILWPVAVQGDTAADQVREAIEGFAALPPQGGGVPRPDMLIVARGGGSVEDLMPFNDEALVRAVAACPIPIISAIGHETDWTLIDYAADMRAPTPTGAAEMAVPVKEGLLLQLADYAARLRQSPQHRLQLLKQKMAMARQALSRPESVIEVWLQKLDERHLRLSGGLQRWVEKWRHRLLSAILPSPQSRLLRAEQGLATASQRLLYAQNQALQRAQQKLHLASRELEAYSYARTLERGFAVVSDLSGTALTSKAELPDKFKIILRDGEQIVRKDG